MRFGQLLIVVGLGLLVACGGGNNTVTPPVTPPPVTPPPPPLVTPIGSSVGTPVSQTIGSSGGTVAAGGIKLEVLAGTLTNAIVTLQPITDTLNGSGQGIAVSSDAAWSKYAKISFPIDASDDYPEGLGLAVQQADGSWRSLEPVKVDVVAGTVTAALPAAAGAAATSSVRPQGGLKLTSVVKFKRFYLKPSSATVKVKGTKSFTPYAQVIQNEKGSCKTPPSDPDEDLAPLMKCEYRQVTREYPFTHSISGFTRFWQVNDEFGGNSSLGKIVSTNSSGATYTAPDKKPSPDTVAVSFLSNQDETFDSVTLTAKVKITDDVQYGGTVDFQGVVVNGLILSGRASMTWNRINPEPFDGGIYQASGTITVTVTDNQGLCNSATLTLGVSAGTLEVLPPAAGQSHKFTLRSTEGQTVLMCPGQKEYFFGVPLDLSDRDFPYTDIALLQGTNQANGDAGAGGTVSWNFKAQ